jgi:hypothetical protein
LASSIKSIWDSAALSGQALGLAKRGCDLDVRQIMETSMADASPATKADILVLGEDLRAHLNAEVGSIRADMGRIEQRVECLEQRVEGLGRREQSGALQRN